MSELKFIELKLVKEYCRVSSDKFNDTLTRLCNGAFDTIQNTIQRTIYANSEAQAAANDGAGDPDGIVINDDNLGFGHSLWCIQAQRYSDSQYRE